MPWEVDLHDAFVLEFEALDVAVQEELLAHVAVLCGGDKSGGSERRFYRQLIAKADDRFDSYVLALELSDTERGRLSKRKSRP